MKNMMQYKDFYASIHYEDETATFWGKIEGIEDIISFEADTVEGLKKEFKEVVEEYIQDCKKWNKNPKKQYKGSFNIRIEPELHKKASLFAKVFDMSLNQFVAKAIRDEIQTCETKKFKRKGLIN